MRAQSTEKRAPLIYTIAWILGLTFGLVKGRWMGQFDFDILAILILYLFLCCGPASIGIFAFIQGFIIDLFSSGLQGLYAFSYLCVFWMIFLGSRSFDLREPKIQLLLIFSAVLLKKALTLILISLFFRTLPVSWPVIWLAIGSAGATGLLAPVVIRIFERLARAVSVKHGFIRKKRSLYI